MTDTIKVNFGRSGGYKDIPIKNIKFVGGEYGVFATYQDGNLVHFLSGDDGHWWQSNSYHIHWLEGIAKNLNSYVTNGRRK